MYISFNRFRSRIIYVNKSRKKGSTSLAWMAMSSATPLYPPLGWWIMTVALGRMYRFPLAPAARSNDPMDMAWPRHSVWMGDWMYWKVSYRARPAVTLPPGELMYIEIGFSGLSASRKRSWATISALTWSVTCHQRNLDRNVTAPFKQIMRSFSNREKMSYVRSDRPWR